MTFFFQSFGSGNHRHYRYQASKDLRIEFFFAVRLVNNIDFLHEHIPVSHYYAYLSCCFRARFSAFLRTSHAIACHKQKPMVSATCVHLSR